MLFVGLHFFVEELKAYTCRFEHLLAFGTCMVLALAYHAFYAAVDDEHGTYAARGHTAV